MNTTLALPSKSTLASICQQYHIRRLSLFGSALGNALRPNSDIDLLVEFDPNHMPGFFTLARIERELSPLFHNRQVDLRTAEDLSSYFRQEVIQQAEPLYATS